MVEKKRIEAMAGIEMASLVFNLYCTTLRVFA